MRLFIAIQFEESILDALTDFQADLKSQGVTENVGPRTFKIVRTKLSM